MEVSSLRKTNKNCLFVYYESRKRELNTRPIYECRCDEKLKTKSEKSTRLAYTGFLGDLDNEQQRKYKISCTAALSYSLLYFEKKMNTSPYYI